MVCVKSRVLGVIASEAKQSFPHYNNSRGLLRKNPRNDTMIDFLHRLRRVASGALSISNIER